MAPSKKARQARRSKSVERADDPWVMCSRCKTWIELEHTQFTSIEEAVAAVTFLCQRCEILDVIQADFTRRIKQEAENWKLAVANLTAKLDEKVAKWEAERLSLEDRFGEEQKVRENLQAKLDAVQASQHCCCGRPEKGTEHLTTSANQTEAGDAGNGTPMKLKDRREPTSMGIKTAPHENTALPADGTETSPTRADIETDCGKNPNKGQGKAATCPRKEELAQTGSANDPLTPKSMTYVGRSMQGSSTQKIWQSCPQHQKQVQTETNRRIFVFGDSNAYGLKPHTLRATRWKKAVRFWTKKEVTLEETCEAVEKMNSVWSTAEAIIALHAGTQDLNMGNAPTESLAQSLHDRLQSWLRRNDKHKFLVYAVPEWASENPSLQNECKKWNARMKELCRELGPRVEFANTNWVTNKELHNDLYSEDTAVELGQRLGRRIGAFLGPAKPNYTRSRKNRGINPAALLMKALEHTITQMAWEQDPGRTWRSRNARGEAIRETKGQKENEVQEPKRGKNLNLPSTQVTTMVGRVLRTKRLAERYGVAPCRLTEKPQRDRRAKVREAVQEAESVCWRKTATEKPALSLYSKAKQAIEKEPMYENSKGSGLLCEARCSMLRTRLLRARYTPNLDTTCPLCTLEDESIEHIVLHCPALQPQRPRDFTNFTTFAVPPPDKEERQQQLLAMALGFRESQEQPQWEAVETTKRRLEHWWRANLQDRTNPAA
ncbi:hypothetical protein HPB52_002169 [Rhipicephalus sanguineus]|uniref:Tick transposon n=1 Tax=Rhipicephalus sanguineus TaxID=34632 RepID=A0A9D4Q9T7_RHISA|nr:hypothetical protein HPB52_002169 [Rhipicephalus sanguineus]